MKNNYYRKYNFKKKLSQIFLHDQFIIDNIIQSISPQINQSMIEIGAGLGALTIPISQHIKSLIAIEIDKNLANKLMQFTLTQKNIKILQQDILSLDLTKIITNTPIRIFGNIPYHISTKIIFYLFKFIHHIQDIHLMLQKEVANRLIAIPNNKQYGKLSVMAQFHCKIINILEVPSTAFIPIPKTNSSFIKLIPHQNNPYSVNNLHNLSKILNIAFSKRRKILKNSLSTILNTQQIIHQGINPKLRAENINIEEYCKLANCLI